MDSTMALPPSYPSSPPRSISLHDCRAELADIKNRHGPELNFMQLEFDRLERELVPDDTSDASAVTRHSRLVYFIAHLTQTMDQLLEMEQLLAADHSATDSASGAPGGAHVHRRGDGANAQGGDSARYWFGVLERLRGLRAHIVDSLLPIKIRLEAQLYGTATVAQPPQSQKQPQSQEPLKTSPPTSTTASTTPPLPTVSSSALPTAAAVSASTIHSSSASTEGSSFLTTTCGIQAGSAGGELGPLPTTSRDRAHALSPAVVSFDGSGSESHQRQLQSAHLPPATATPSLEDESEEFSDPSLDFDPIALDPAAPSHSMTTKPPRDKRNHSNDEGSVSGGQRGHSFGLGSGGLGGSAFDLHGYGGGSYSMDVGTLDDLGDWEIATEAAALADANDHSSGDGGVVRSGGSLGSGLDTLGDAGGARKRFRGQDGHLVNAFDGVDLVASGHDTARPPSAKSRTTTATANSGEAASSHAAHAHTQHARTPKSVEYQCSLCAVTYASTSTFNAWWALTRESCPKCGELQIPRIDIAEPANQPEYHPALLRATLAEGGGVVEDDEAESGGQDHHHGGGFDSGGGQHGRMGDGSANSGDAVGHVTEESDEVEDDADDLGGPHRMPPDQAAKLLVLIAHARTCPGHHLSRAHGEVCKSVKYLMLHIRDCCGRTPDGQACGFPWCKPCKHLIHHLVKCKQPDRCAICSPHDLPPALLKLRALNQLREAPSAAATAHNHTNNHTAHQQPPPSAANAASGSGHSSSANHH